MRVFIVEQVMTDKRDGDNTLIAYSTLSAAKEAVREMIDEIAERINIPNGGKWKTNDGVLQFIPAHDAIDEYCVFLVHTLGVIEE